MRINAGDTAWVLVSAALVHVHDAGAGAVLRRHGAGQERAGHAHAELLLPGAGQRALGRVHVLARVPRHRQVDRQPRPRVPRRTPTTIARDRLRRGADPAAVVLRVPADVRGHHARADHRRDRRPHEVLGVVLVRRAVGAGRVHAGRALGVLAGGLAVPPRRARLRRRHRRAHQRRDRRARRGARDRPSARVAATPDRRRTRCRSRCSAPASCGSAGSGSTPARRSAANGIAAQAFINTHMAAAAAMLGWLLFERIRRRARHDARRGVGRGRRARRDHAVRRVRRRHGADLHRVRSPARSATSR